MILQIKLWLLNWLYPAFEQKCEHKHQKIWELQYNGMRIHECLDCNCKWSEE